ncbi:14092_t:CDS:2, partial [Entrophospora sp. SA101]
IFSYPNVGYRCAKTTTVELNYINRISEKKLAKVICPDKWKEGSRNVNVGTDRKLNENKLLSKPGKNRFKPYENKCKVCKSRVHQEHAHYCQGKCIPSL